VHKKDESKPPRAPRSDRKPRGPGFKSGEKKEVAGKGTWGDEKAAQLEAPVADEAAVAVEGEN
jgi:hypothetical protein